LGLRRCAWGARPGVLELDAVRAGVEALACAATKAMKTASRRSVPCLFIGTYNFPEKRIPVVAGISAD
jgi:hypothetical protein